MPAYGRGYTGTDVVAAESEKQYVYSDFFLAFRPSPMFTDEGLTGDISRKYDRGSIKQSVQQIVLTNRYERPWNPEFGCNIRNQLFEPLDGWAAYEIKKSINEQLRRCEPRIAVENVLVNEDAGRHYLNIQLDYKIKPITTDSILESMDVQVQVERIR